MVNGAWASGPSSVSGSVDVWRGSALTRVMTTAPRDHDADAEPGGVGIAVHHALELDQLPLCGLGSRHWRYG